MDKLKSLLEVANRLDSIGMYDDADKLDKIALALQEGVERGTQKIHSDTPQYPKSINNGQILETLRYDIKSVIDFLNRVKDIKEEIAEYSPGYLEKLTRYLNSSYVPEGYKTTLRTLYKRVEEISKNT